MLPLVIDRLLHGSLGALLIVHASALIAVTAGLLRVIWRLPSAPDWRITPPPATRLRTRLIHGLRAAPFGVLSVALLPLTRRLTGAAIGAWPVVVRSALGPTPFCARIAEVSLREVDAGLIEAAQATVSRRWHSVRHVPPPEALPRLIGGFTIPLMSMIGASMSGASAMTGAVGAGGRGDNAFRYGYQRFDTRVRVVAVAILMVPVCSVQFVGECRRRALRKR